MPQLGKIGPKLLKEVGGKRHASDEDHEEPLAKHRQSLVTKKARKEKNIYAEPSSSDNEIRNPPPRTSRPSIPIPPALNSTPDGTGELHLPRRKSSRRQADSADTPNGSMEKVQSGRAKKGQDEDKENTSLAASQSSSASVTDDAFEWDMQYTSQQSAKSARTGLKKFGPKAKTVNIHAQQISKRFGVRPAIRVPLAHAKNREQAEKGMKHINEDDSNFLMVEEPPTPEKQPDPELRKRESMKQLKKMHHDSNAKYNDDELDQVLAEPSEDEVPLEDEELKRRPRRAKPKILHDQLGDWQQDQAPKSSQPESSAPQEALDNIKDYIEQLPEEEEEGSICHICKTPVGMEEYWDYWKGKDKTVKNQNVFCRTHRTKSAWEEYRSEGYPDVDWNALPQRIRKHRMELFKILNNDRPSGYRDRYKPIALTGKAAAVPSRRKDLPKHIQEELESYALDDQLTYPGYYGPHGRRVITENVMKVLKNEIKNCSDAVVQGSGPATFVQAVLVPETAILLIMEDCRVDREEAEEIREKTYDMGMLLNEEIDDDIEVHDQSDVENEYGGR